MSDLRSCHHRHEQIRQKFEDKCHALENELRRKNETINALRYVCDIIKHNLNYCYR